MIVTIKGLKDESYVKNDEKKTEVVQVRVYYERKLEDVTGIMCGSELITARRCPEAVEKLFELGEKALGAKAIISKDTSTFNGNSYAFVDEFEIVK